MHNSGFTNVDGQVERAVVQPRGQRRRTRRGPGTAPRCGDIDLPARAGAARSCRIRRATRRAAGAWRRGARRPQRGVGLSSSSSGASGGSGARAPASRTRPALVVISQRGPSRRGGAPPAPPCRPRSRSPARAPNAPTWRHQPVPAPSRAGHSGPWPAHDIECLPLPVSRPARAFRPDQLAIERQQRPQPARADGRLEHQWRGASGTTFSTTRHELVRELPSGPPSRSHLPAPRRAMAARARARCDSPALPHPAGIQSRPRRCA